MYYIRIMLAGFILILCCIEDIKYKKIHIILPVSVVVSCIVIDIISGDFVITDIIMRVCIGIVIIIFGACSKEKIGIGDGFIAVMIGIAVGVELLFQIMILAFVAALVFFGIYAVNCLVKRTKVVDKEIAFVPFVLGAYMFVVVISLIQI